MQLESILDPTIKAEVDRSHFAPRVSLRPFEHRTRELIGGHYRTVFTTGLTTILNAGDAIGSLRWDNPTKVFGLLRLRASASLTTAFGAAQETSVDIVKMSGFTAADTGGTPIVLGSGSKKAAWMASSGVADLRVAGAAALGAGTGVAEANPFGKAVLALGNALGASASELLFDAPPGQESPAFLQPLEGFRVRIAFTQGAAGVVRFTFVLDWMETPSSLLI